MKVFITMFNRFTWAIPLCEDFVKAGCEVILIDNNSTYPPILEWYKKCPYKVHYMGNNSQTAWVFFTSELYAMYKNERYFIISDSDMDISKVPNDFVSVLFKGLEHPDDPHVWKSALAYELDDLPDGPYTDLAKSANSGQWSVKNSSGFFECATDLGIALYDRERRGEWPSKEPFWYSSVRAPRPYIARHLDWYMTEENLREEDIYYLQHSGYYSYLALWNDKYNSHPVKHLQ